MQVSHPGIKKELVLIPLIFFLALLFFISVYCFLVCFFFTASGFRLLGEKK